MLMINKVHSCMLTLSIGFQEAGSDGGDSDDANEDGPPADYAGMGAHGPEDSYPRRASPFLPHDQYSKQYSVSDQLSDMYGEARRP